MQIRSVLPHSYINFTTPASDALSCNKKVNRGHTTFCRDHWQDQKCMEFMPMDYHFDSKVNFLRNSQKLAYDSFGGMMQQ